MVDRKIPPARILESSKCRSQYAGVNKTIHSRQAELVRQTLISMRKRAGLTQRQLAAKLAREHSLVGRLELGERRLDMVEFFCWCRTCKANPAEEASALMRKLGAS
jgi:hypothetical protein